MGKPRAARKKAVVLSDSDQDEPRSPPPKRPRRGTLKGASSTAASSTAKSPVKSPAKSPGKPTPIYKPITSFFSNAPRVPKAQPTPSPEKPTTPLEDIDDILDSSTDEDRPSTRPAALPVRKGIKTASSVDNGNVGKGSQKFRFASGGARSTPPPPQLARQDTVDRRPWTEKYGPVSLDELAVHKRKVADVRTWLSNAFSGRERKRLLLLKGPAGSGKTTTMSLLSKELGVEMHEWKNPTNSMSSSEGFTSATAQFEDFVGRTGAFGSLSFDEPATARPQGLPNASSSRQKQLILVEEFPNTFTRTSSVVQNFRTAILNYLAANTPSATAFFSGKTDSEQSVTPIVMIVSETLLSTNTAAADSFTAHRLLGPDILTHPGVTVIEFNPIAPTYMTKALEQIVLKEARKSGRRKTVGPQVIQRLSELGDIRSALSSLEFLCLRGDESDGWGAKVNFTKKKSSKDVPLTEMEQESLEMVTQRESTLGIFHAVGRVLYNKRLPEDPSHPVPQPPNWFPERRRPKASEVNVDSLIDELGTDTQTFIAALHENYVLSCGGADSEETMDSVDGCIESLSDADLLSPDRFSRSAFGGRNFQGTSSDNLRQDEMSFQTSVRGLLYNLPNPVKRLAPPPGIMGMKAKGAGAGAAASKGSAFVMYYPASLRLWKQQEEIGGLLEMWISRAQRGELLGASSLTHKPTTVSTGGVDTWRKATPFAQSTQTPSAGADIAANEPPPPVLLGSGGSARNEMLLERLPYLPIILRQSRMPSTSLNSTIREIQKITSFTKSNGGFASTEGDLEDDLEEPTAGEHEQWATDKPATETPRKKRRVMISSKKDEASSGLPGIGEKMAKGLVLSDDDIED